LRGRVVEFDEHVGLGAVEGEDGTRLEFHCVAIADGSRRIDVGAAVTYDVVPGRLGRYEAWGIERLGASGRAERA
jgi:cold shock CspA family protein